jgi:hypothetical protein
MHGNPWLRLLRREVEALARARHGGRYVSEQQARAELTRVNREIRRLRSWPNSRSGEPSSAPTSESKRPGVVCRKPCDKPISAVMT